MPSLADIKPLIEEKLVFLGMDLYDLKFVSAGKKSVLRIYIEREGGVRIEDCERASLEISMLLDVEEFAPGQYMLEVSSPGLDRLLQTQKHFKYVIGQFVNIQLKAEKEGASGKTITGKCLSSSDDAITLEKDDGQELSIPLADIAKGTIDIRFK